MEAALNDVADWLAAIFTRVKDWLVDSVKATLDTLTDMANKVANAIRNIASSVTNFIQQMWQDLATQINTLVESALGFLQSLYQRVADGISFIFDNVVDYLQTAFNILQERLIALYDQVANAIVDMYNTVKDTISNFVDTMILRVQEVFDFVRSGIATIVERAAVVVNAIVQAIKDFISSVVDTIGGTLRALTEAAASIPDRLTDLGTRFGDSIEEFIGRPLTEVPKAIWLELIEHATTVAADYGEFIEPRTKEIMTGRVLAAESREQFDSLFTDLIPKSPLARNIFNFVLLPFLLLRLGSGIADANAQIALQEFGEEHPYNIPQVAEAIQLKHFGIIPDSEAVTLIRKQGYSPEHAQQLIQIGETVPPEGEALSWWLRGIFTDEQLDLALDKKGWTDESKAAIREAAFFIPPVQDLITMAVREVFTPAVAERFGQFEDFPEDFAEQAKKTGVSEEWAKNYWAAHWALPSVQMGYEMLHRRVISEEDLSLLLKSADVMPFWRDKLIAISFAPFTRVDIRRMHKVGVLSEEEVFEAYQDIGYNTEKARRLTDFTLELNRDKTLDDFDDLNKITRSAITGWYAAGLMDRLEAFNLLLALDISEEGANLYLNAIDLDEQLQERKDETTLILEQAKAGMLTFDRAQDKLAELGLETRELSKALTTLVRAQAQKTKLPSKEDLNKMLKQGLITEQTYMEGYQRLGYSEEWSEVYLQMAKGA